jgi:hypothetical protein
MAKKLTDQEWLAKLHYCGICKQVLPLSFFWHKIRSPEEMTGKSKCVKRRWKHSHCKKCEPIAAKASGQAERQRDYNRRRRQDQSPRGLNWVLRRILAGIRKRVKDHNLSFDLTTEFLEELYRSQEGKCYYTGTPLVWGTGGHVSNSISVDRRVPADGYVRANVVLCAYDINRLKSSCSDEELYSLCQVILDCRDSRAI